MSNKLFQPHPSEGDPEAPLSPGSQSNPTSFFGMDRVSLGIILIMLIGAGVSLFLPEKTGIIVVRGLHSIRNPSGVVLDKKPQFRLIHLFSIG